MVCLSGFEPKTRRFTTNAVCAGPGKTEHDTARARKKRRVARTKGAAYTCTMRIVGKQNRSEIELDPVKAYRRGRTLDAMLRNAAPPIARGVLRGTHEHFNRLDAKRQAQAARALNAA